MMEVMGRGGVSLLLHPTLSDFGAMVTLIHETFSTDSSGLLKTTVLATLYTGRNGNLPSAIRSSLFCVSFLSFRST